MSETTKNPAKKTGITTIYDEDKTYTVEELTQIVKVFKDAIEGYQESMEAEEEANREMQNGASVVCLIDDDKVVVGKYVEKYECVITNMGEIIPADKVITFNLIGRSSGIQDALYNEAFQAKLAELDMDDEPSEEDIESIINTFVSTDSHYMNLSQDLRNIVATFNRQLRNGNVQVSTYKFTIYNLIYGEDDPNYYDERIDLRAIHNTFINYESMVHLISKETFDYLDERISKYNTETGASSNQKSVKELAQRYGIDLRNP